MATINQLYGTTNQSITCTITSLGSGSARESTAVVNTANLFMDVKVQVCLLYTSDAADDTR